MMGLVSRLEVGQEVLARLAPFGDKLQMLRTHMVLDLQLQSLLGSSDALETVIL